MKKEVNVIGAGLAGAEAAYQLAKRGIEVNLYEMKRIKKNDVQKLDTFAELVCSNSLRSNDIHNAAGLMKEELRKLDSLVIKIADKAKLPAGSALAVDRELFSKLITEALLENPRIHIYDKEITDIDLDKYTIIATGPLTSDALMVKIQEFLGEDMLYFYDAIAPIIEYDSIDMTVAYFKSRYDKGSPDYINCPMTKEEYDNWYKEVIKAKAVEVKDFEKNIFEGCMPFEEMARRGEKTLLFGPMKPVGLGKEGEKRPYAVVQLRQDNLRKSLYNIVGFQTHLTFPEQKRIIHMIPGLEKANIVRYGIMHRNSFINAPKSINQYYQSKKNPKIFFAGQLSGIEGYVESIGSGIIAGINMSRFVRNMDLFEFSQYTALGSQSFYISHAEPSYFQPMNTNFGIFPDLKIKHHKKQRKELYAMRSLKAIDEMIEGGVLE
ncbi:MAG: methylenetetrahydrofolate--tRNA-(uracil(54)-C(5))-methyltransferase (FADH(2)-oxidizing) TrmFO [Tenericutes bacterium 4572_104]|nr:MAG: methylenetetrahydrofolate--tRNA-(uracil(54)-C(5))-methyltransferase (FADH(2)-oxidizing) TrmFO [Tenericutes bacterium 4572_104]